jgi:hypothetical protein
MVRIEEVGGSRLPPIPEESSGSTRTQIEDYEEVFPPFPPGFGGMILNISADEPTVDGETEQDRDARVARNTHRPSAELARMQRKMQVVDIVSTAISPTRSTCAATIRSIGPLPQISPSS